MNESRDVVSLCAVRVDGRLFGIGTREVREVLGHTRPHRVPLAPIEVAGVVPYRGDVLTTVSLRALLGLPELDRAGSVLVFENEALEERFGLAVDGVEGVATVFARELEQNPSTLDARSMGLFDGVYRSGGELMVRLSYTRLQECMTIKGANEL